MSTTTELSTAEVLRRAKAVLIERGWTQGRYVNGAGGVCSYGAINVAVTGDPRRCGGYLSPDEEVANRAAWLVSKAAGRQLHLLDEWNDDPNRTKAEVLAAFGRAIALAESEAS